MAPPVLVNAQPGQTVVSETSGVYYQGQYWNDLPPVLRYMCECFTGDPEKSWTLDFRERYCERPFENALFLNCGNGWVEREFVDLGMVRNAVAFDYSHELLAKAEEERGERSIRYFQADCNKVEFDEDEFDLVVNVAALHHVQYVDRMCRVLCRALRPGGVFVNYDYIGPSRNQYSRRQWSLIKRTNRRLPPSVRKPRLAYPHLATMLVTDPTEAIHSGEVVEMISRYFTMVERHDTGGGVAYDLLTHNPRLSTLPPDELDGHVDRILAVDREATARGQVPPMFSYFIARPAKPVLRDAERLRAWEREEAERERLAARRGGTYRTADYARLQRQLVRRHVAIVWRPSSLAVLRAARASARRVLPARLRRAIRSLLTLQV
jgi:SAM-dependent methyltransferase